MQKWQISGLIIVYCAGCRLSPSPNATIEPVIQNPYGNEVNHLEEIRQLQQEAYHQQQKIVDIQTKKQQLLQQQEHDLFTIQQTIGQLTEQINHIFPKNSTIEQKKYLLIDQLNRVNKTLERLQHDIITHREATVIHQQKIQQLNETLLTIQQALQELISP